MLDFCSGWPWTCNPPTVSSWVAEITGIHHLAWLLPSFLMGLRFDLRALHLQSRHYHIQSSCHLLMLFQLLLSGCCPNSLYFMRIHFPECSHAENVWFQMDRCSVLVVGGLSPSGYSQWQLINLLTCHTEFSTQRWRTYQKSHQTFSWQVQHHFFPILGMGTRALCMLGKHCINWATAPPGSLISI
jgi:hypothetical protein